MCPAARRQVVLLLSAAARPLRVAPHVVVWLGTTAVNALERHSGWWVANGYRISLDVLREVVPQRGDMVSPETAWWALQEMLPEPVLAVLFWRETTTVWWRWVRAAVSTTEVLARLHVPGGHARSVLVQLAWVGLPDGSDNEEDDGEDPDLPDDGEEPDLLDDDPESPEKDIPGLIAGINELISVLTEIQAE